MAYGVTDEGFVIKRFDVIFAEIHAALKAATQWGPGVNVAADSPLGQLLKICAEREALVWEIAQAVYDSNYPDSSTKASLDNVCALIGVARLPSTRSTVTETLTGTAGTVIGVGAIIATDPGGDRFETLADATIGPGVPGTVDVEMRAQVYGAIAAPAETLKTIITNVAGWDSATNGEDADLGREIETDTALRLRRFLSLQIGGRSTVGGLFANLLQRIDDVFAVAVVENDGDVADAEGRPPHSVECIVKGGLEQEILDMIWDLKAAGIETCGTGAGAISGTVVDTQGYPHTVEFSRPTDIDLWVHIEIEVDEDSFNVGSALKEKITIDTNTEPNYSVTINGTTYSTPGVGTKAQIATALMNAVNAGLWVPVTASEDAAGDEFFYLTSDYEGNDFAPGLAVSAGMTIIAPPITPSSGDEKAVEDAVLAYGEANQGIGDDFIRSKYYTPINAASDHILTINVRVSTVRWPNAGPVGGEANVAILMSQIGDIDTLRTTVEVI